VQSYLRSRFASDVEVTTVKRSFPGMSRDTWLVRVTSSEGGGEASSRGFVFRMDAPGGSICPTPLKREYEVYRRLYGTAVPVPRTYWYETDQGWLTSGREFYVRELVDGAMEVPHLFDDNAEGSALRLAVGRELVEKLAAVHLVDWKALGFDAVFEAPPDTASTARFDLDLWEDILDRELLEPEPLLRLIFNWLRSNPPPPTTRICLCKGNNGLSEEVWRGTEIVSMNDWELAHLGDPAEDWVSMELNPMLGQRGIDPSIDEKLLLRWYEELTGTTITPERIHYFELVRGLKTFVNLVAAARIVDRGEAQRASTAGMALALYRYLGPFARQLKLIS